MKKFFAFYPKNVIWHVNGKNIIEEVYYLYDRKNNTNFHINTMNPFETERIVKECEDDEGEEYEMTSLIDGDVNKMRLITNVKINTKKMLDMLNDCGYEDSLK